jgi:uncharacterized protein (TIGR02996 family)
VEVEVGFMNALRIHPYDDVTRAVYADWHEEQSDPRSEFLRLQVAVKSLLSMVDLEAAQHRLRVLRVGLDPAWLQVVEPVVLLSELSIRARKTLRNANISTLRELCELTEDEFWNFGGGFSEVRDKLAEQGLSFRDPNSQ